MQRLLEGFPGGEELRICISSWKEKLLLMPEAVREARYVLEADSMPGIFFFVSWERDEEHSLSQEDPCLLGVTYLQAGDEKALYEFLDERMRCLKEEGAEEASVFLFLACLLDRMAEKLPPEKEGLLRGVLLGGQEREEGDAIERCILEARKRLELFCSTDERASYLRSALYYLAEHFQEDVSLDELSGRLGLSSFYLTRLLKRFLGSGFSELLLGYRMSACLRLMQRRTELSLREIGALCGYPSETYFHRVFKKSLGMTAGRAREVLERFG